MFLPQPSSCKWEWDCSIQQSWNLVPVVNLGPPANETDQAEGEISLLLKVHCVGIWWTSYQTQKRVIWDLRNILKTLKITNGKIYTKIPLSLIQWFKGKMYSIAVCQSFFTKQCCRKGHEPWEMRFYFLWPHKNLIIRFLFRLSSTGKPFA